MIILLDSRFGGGGVRAGGEWYGKEYYLLRRKFQLLESTTVLIFAFVGTC